ncbi:MAG: LysM peptidoglycan-binding domain-containing protein [Elusimicrobia bacterium]|nr:LysM peptidoglycan-binding domain-containing protein [Elusimicrobiota bacterium]
MRPTPASVKLTLSAALAVLAAAARAGEFPDILPGARPAAIGAYTALSDDVWGLYFNPAGLNKSPFPQMGLALGRHLSPRGAVAYHGWAYTRPFPVRPGATVGAGFLGMEQSGVGDKNELLLHYSDALALPQFYIPRPFGVGGNLKIVQVKPPGKPNKLGLSLDGGALFETPGNGRVGASVTDLNTGLGVPSPTLSLGGAWTWDRRVTLAADLKLNPARTEFNPGLEWAVFQRLLKLRVGKGQRLDGAGAIGLGFGADFSPLSIDLALNVPTAGWNAAGAAYVVSAQWRFGAPSFHGRFVGTAAARAEDLRSEILELERRQKDAAARARAADADNQSISGQVQAEEERLRSLQEESRQLETEIERRRYDLGHPRPEAAKPVPAPAPKAAPAPKPRPAAAPVFPLRHRVVPGDSLRRLADRYYGDPSLWEQVYDANPDKVERGLPVEGETLLIPAPRRR